VLDKETPKEMKERLLNSKRNLDKGENVVAFSWKEFDVLSKKLIGKK
jgi:hypothetical protein